MTIVINGTTGISGVDGSAGTPAVQGTDTNTGVFFPAADTIAFTTGGTEDMRIDSSGNLLFNSGYGSVATAYGCRAWVNFNGAATPITINASGNVSTIGDIGIGIYQINFSSAMPDENYAVCSIGARSTTSTTNNVSTLVVDGTYTTLSVQVFNERSNDGAQIDAQQSVMVVR